MNLSRQPRDKLLWRVCRPQELKSACSLTAIHAGGALLAVKRKFHVTLIEDDEGVSISCPELPGCHSQGVSVEDALRNIEDAIREYLEAYGEPQARCEIREMEVVTA